MVADALSRLDIMDTPFEDTKESFLGLMECFAKKPEESDFHPLNYQHLKIAQEQERQNYNENSKDKGYSLCSKRLPWRRSNYFFDMLQR